MVVYRLVEQGPHLSTALTGEGARLYGGRWNPKGLPAVYCSATLSLAVLEFRVNRRVFDPGRKGLYFALRFEESDVEFVTNPPAGWTKHFNDDGSLTPAQEFGATWLREARSPVLCVPSSVIQVEKNFVLNPVHPGFEDLTIDGRPERFEFDPRLW
jgi:RES domain-containing protein